jgi:hypothetical protein
LVVADDFLHGLDLGPDDEVDSDDLQQDLGFLFLVKMGDLGRESELQHPDERQRSIAGR